ncbi:MAG: endolytic transglycosylase MltG [Alphaproteobacteria bacterium]|nr:endolytic transglycosylase MltG [Alphaproteobacteria bacterium]
MGWFVSLLLFLLIALGTVAGGAIVMLNRAYTDPGPLAETTVVVIPDGASGQQIMQRLGDSGVVADPRLARVSLRFLADARPLRAGEYEFPAGISLQAAIAKLQDGDTVVRRVTIAEGLTTREALGTLSLANGLVGMVPEPNDVGEGTLLPETYHYSLGDTRAELVARMQAAMDETVARLWDARAEGLPIKSPEEAVVLASIIERETAVPSERPMVASVFVNRLKRGMRLQSDPTVAYGFSTDEGEFSGRLLFRHLETDHPYNTYTRDGLPPGPIANPGAESIAAALNPAATDYLYFVADGTGGHAFAKTLAEHNRNVAKWRRIQRERRGAQ